MIEYVTDSSLHNDNVALLFCILNIIICGVFHTKTQKVPFNILIYASLFRNSFKSRNRISLQRSMILCYSAIVFFSGYQYKYLEFVHPLFVLKFHLNQKLIAAQLLLHPPFFLNCDFKGPQNKTCVYISYCCVMGVGVAIKW